MTEPLVAPFPYFGGKRAVAEEVWSRLGDVANYVEPFCGSAAVLLARPHASKTETINDKDGFICNFWRAVKWAPEKTAEWADWPVSEYDTHARHYWLITEGRRVLEGILGDPHSYDAKVAGWWCWGACSWIGSGWCSGEGPWRWDGERWRDDARDTGVRIKLPHVGDAGRGINRQLPHVSSAGMGINRKLPHVGDAGRGRFIREWFGALSQRLRDVRVCGGEWNRVLGDSVTICQGLTGILLDPPYSAADRADVYAHDDFQVAQAAREWAITTGSNTLLRIAFCGYDGEFSEPWPDGWTEWSWKAHGGYGSQGNGQGRANSQRERIWFSPHCLEPRQPSLLDWQPRRLEAAE